MNLEKLGLILFIKYLKQLESVKSHLMAAIRELLLAISSTLKLSSQMTSDHFLLKHFSPLEKSLHKIDHVLRFAVEQLKEDSLSESTESQSHLKENIVESIVSVIDEEIKNISLSSSQNQKLKIEALNTVKTVLYNHLNPLNHPSEDIIEIESLR